MFSFHWGESIFFLLSYFLLYILRQTAGLCCGVPTLTRPFFFVSSFLHSTYVDHGNKIQNALVPATTDPPQVTVKLWLRWLVHRGGKRSCTYNSHDQKWSDTTMMKQKKSGYGAKRPNGTPKLLKNGALRALVSFPPDVNTSKWAGTIFGPSLVTMLEGPSGWGPNK